MHGPHFAERESRASAAAGTSWSAATSYWPKTTGGRLHVMTSPRRDRWDPPPRLSNAGSRHGRSHHHFSLTDVASRSFDSNFKMNPPLRSATMSMRSSPACRWDDRVIATDHARTPKRRRCGSWTRPRSASSAWGNPQAGGYSSHRTGPSRLALHAGRLTIHPPASSGFKGTLALGADADITILDRGPLEGQRRVPLQERNTAFRQHGTERPRHRDRRRRSGFSG